MQLNFKPTGNRVLIEPLRLNDATTRGLIIPENAKEEPSEGIVVAISDAINRDEIPIQLGNRVVFNRYEGTPIVVNQKPYKLFVATELLAIIE